MAPDGRRPTSAAGSGEWSVSIRGMKARGWGRVLVTALATTTISGCSILNPPMRVPGGDVCVFQATSDPSEAVWFGIFIENMGTAPISLTGARLGESGGATLLDTLAIPEVIDSDGDHLTLGTAKDLATDQPQMWAVRQPVEGFTLHPGQPAAVALRIVRTPGAATATVHTQDITYRVEGEPFIRPATSRQLIAVGVGDCEPTG